MSKVKRIICFGDSFTQGDGVYGQFIDELKNKFNDTLDPRHENNAKSIRYLINSLKMSNSWPSQVSKLMKIEYVNEGQTGASNNMIFNRVFNYLSKNDVLEGDVFIIMWSSTIRDYLPFFPSMYNTGAPVHIGWSLKELFSDTSTEHFGKVFEEYLENNPNQKQREYIKGEMQSFFSEFSKDYLTNLYDETYYKILNQNYIYVLQEYFKKYNIRYKMVDAFESMTSFGFDKKVEELIDKEHYIGFGKTTAWDWVNELGDKEYFEDPRFVFNPQGQKSHPNEKGYKVIAEKIAKQLVF